MHLFFLNSFGFLCAFSVLKTPISTKKARRFCEPFKFVPIVQGLSVFCHGFTIPYDDGGKNDDGFRKI